MVIAVLTLLGGKIKNTLGAGANSLQTATLELKPENETFPRTPLLPMAKAAFFVRFANCGDALAFSQMSPPISSPKLPFWARIETLWLAFVPVCAAIYALCLPLAPNDLWYHVRAGELISQSGAIPTTNAMSAGVSLDKPYFYQSWLAQWLLFQTLKLGGLTALQGLRAICVVVAFVSIIGASWHWAKAENLENRAARPIAAATLGAFLLASNNLDLRPQSFSLVLCGLWIWALIGFWKSPNFAKIAILAILAALWANLHGAFVIAPASILVLAVAQSFVSSARKFWLAAAAVFGATLLNPHGWNLYFYLARLSQDVVSQKYIEEWRSPGFDEWHGVLFWISPLFLAILWNWARPQRAFWPFLAPLGLTFLMGARDQRAMIWFGLFLAPLASVLLASKLRVPVLTPIPRAAQFINGFLLVFLLLAPLVFSPRVKAILPWPPAFAARFAPTPTRLFPGDPPFLLDRTTPVAAVEWWNENQKMRPKSVWCDMVCGSYLTWATRPTPNQSATLPFCEPRIELYSESFWENYLRLSRGPKNADALLRADGFSQALVDVENQKPLFGRLQKESWRIVARNGSTALLIR